MKKTMLVQALALAAASVAFGAHADTLKKIKDSGTITIGHRDSSKVDGSLTRLPVNDDPVFDQHDHAGLARDLELSILWNSSRG